MASDMSNQPSIGPNLRVKVEQQKTIFGKRNKHSFVATLGDTGWYANGTCKQGAAEQLHADLTHTERFSQSRRYIRVQGATFALYFARGGWQYDIVRDNSASQFSTAMLSTYSFNEAYAAMERHAVEWTKCNAVAA